jgi:hypothetical protein
LVFHDSLAINLISNLSLVALFWSTNPTISKNSDHFFHSSLISIWLFNLWLIKFPLFPFKVWSRNNISSISRDVVTAFTACYKSF